LYLENIVRAFVPSAFSLCVKAVLELCSLKMGLFLLAEEQLFGIKLNLVCSYQYITDVSKPKMNDEHGLIRFRAKYSHLATSEISNYTDLRAFLSSMKLDKKSQSLRPRKKPNLKSLEQIFTHNLPPLCCLQGQGYRVIAWWIS